MSYISHEDYKNLMGKFQKQTPKGILKESFDRLTLFIRNYINDRKLNRITIGDQNWTNLVDVISSKFSNEIGDPQEFFGGELLDMLYDMGVKVDHGVEEGNAFTAALAKTKKGGKAKVDGKEITDTSSYDDPSVKEYGYADNYPGSWGYKEGQEDSNDPMHSRAYDMAAKLMGMGQGKDEVYQFLVNKQNVDGAVAQSMVDDLFGSGDLEDDDDMWIDPAGGTHYGDDDPAAMYREGLNPAPMQATGPTIDVTEERLNVQSPEEVAKFVAAKHPDLGLKMGMDREKTALKHAYDAIVNVSGEVVARNLVNSLSNPDWPSDYLQALKGMLANKEGLKPAPMQATGQSIKEDVAPYGFDVLPPGTKQQLQTSGLKELSPDDRKRLKEYIESVKEIQKEIVKLAAKAGKKIKMEGGNMTGLTLGPSVTSEDEGAIKVGDIVIPNLGPHKGQKHVVIAVLPDGTFNIKPQWPGLSASQIKYRQGAAKAKADQIQKVNEDDDAETQHMISKMEKEKEGEGAVKGQYDPH